MKQDKPTEVETAKAVIELAKTLLPAAIAAQGPMNPSSTNQEVASYFDRATNLSFSLAGMFRRKAKDVLSQAQKADEDNAS